MPGPVPCALCGRPFAPVQLTRHHCLPREKGGTREHVERICRQVKRWQRGDHRLRWMASALIFVESRWNRLHGYLQIPALINALEEAYYLRLRELHGLTRAGVA